MRTLLKLDSVRFSRRGEAWFFVSLELDASARVRDVSALPTGGAEGFMSSRRTSMDFQTNFYPSRGAAS
jgi:hypothetical protein